MKCDKLWKNIIHLLVNKCVSLFVRELIQIQCLLCTYQQLAVAIFITVMRLMTVLWRCIQCQCRQLISQFGVSSSNSHEQKIFSFISIHDGTLPYVQNVMKGKFPLFNFLACLAHLHSWHFQYFDCFILHLQEVKTSMAVL